MWEADLMSDQGLVTLEADARRFCIFNGKIADLARRVISARYLGIGFNDAI